MEGFGLKVKVIALNHFRLRFMSMSMSMSSSPALSLSSTLFHGGGGHIKKNNNKNKFLLSHSLSSSLSPFSTRTLFPERRFDGIAAGPHGVVQPMSMSSPHHHQQQQHASASHNHLLQVVLVSPQIPGNTGCIARTCAASGVKLHLVEPLGFQIDDTKLKRAGLDYWPYVVVKVHSSWAEFREYFSLQEGEKRLLAFTKRGTAIHSDFTYRPGDWLVFGSETSGLPPDALLDCKSETYGGGAIKIPMVDTYVRCLNLSVSVGIAVYEAARQLNYEQLQYSPETCMNGEDLFIAEDIFA